MSPSSLQDENKAFSFLFRAVQSMNDGMLQQVDMFPG